MGNGNKSISKVILFFVIFLIIGGVVGYFIGENSHKNSFIGRGIDFPKDNFQINETTKAEIESFFENAQSTNEIDAYCQSNPMYCMEYCRNINPSHEVCNELNASFRGGMPAR